MYSALVRKLVTFAAVLDSHSLVLSGTGRLTAHKVQTFLAS